MGRRKTNFEESAFLNNTTYGHYVRRLMELAITSFEWDGLPDTIDPRFLEITLFLNGQAIFFYDEYIGYLALEVVGGAPLDVYRVPVTRHIYASSGYNATRTIDDSVMIFNNYLRTPCYPDILIFAKRLYSLDRIIDVNSNAQKTPVLVQGNEQQRLTLLNLYKEYDGNAPVIFGDKSIDINSLKAISTNAPFVSDKIYQLKSQIWNEALTYLGISNMQVNKKERLLEDEVARQLGGTLASRNSRLKARQQACEKINKMFGLNVSVHYIEDDYKVGSTDSMDDAVRGFENE